MVARVERKPGHVIRFYEPRPGLMAIAESPPR
jgi:hypothetical protein